MMLSSGPGAFLSVQKLEIRPDPAAAKRGCVRENAADPLGWR